MKILTLAITTLISSIMLVTCKKVKPGIETTVKGYVIDSVKNKRLSNAQVVVYGCNVNFGYGGQVFCTDSVAGVKTDANGDFSTSFVSDGTANSYRVRVKTEGNYREKNEVKLEAGKENSVVLSAIEFNMLKLDLKVLSNPIGELTVRTSYTTYYLKGTSNDVVLKLKVYPNAKNSIYYTVYDTKIGKYRRFEDELQIGTLDTTYFQKIIQTTDDFKP